MVPVTPAGAPVTVKSTVPLNPPLLVSVAVTMVEPPWATDAEVGLRDREIDGVGPGPVEPPLELQPAKTVPSISPTTPRNVRTCPI